MLLRYVQHPRPATQGLAVFNVASVDCSATLQTARIAAFSGFSCCFAAETATFRRSGWKFGEFTIILRGSIQLERRRSRCILAFSKLFDPFLIQFTPCLIQRLQKSHFVSLSFAASETAISAVLCELGSRSSVLLWLKSRPRKPPTRNSALL